MKPNVTNRIILFILTVVYHVGASEDIKYDIKIKTKKTVCEVDEKFVSIAIGTGQARKQWTIIDFNSQRLKTLLRQLQPAYFRLGGSDANFLYFEEPSTLNPLSVKMPKKPKPGKKPKKPKPAKKPKKPKPGKMPKQSNKNKKKPDSQDKSKGDSESNETKLNKASNGDKDTSNADDNNTESEMGPGTESDAGSNSRPQSVPWPGQQPGSKQQPGSQQQPGSRPNSGPKPQSTPEPQPGLQPAPQPGPQPGQQPGPQPESQPWPKPRPTATRRSDPEKNTEDGYQAQNDSGVKVDLKRASENEERQNNQAQDTEWERLDNMQSDSEDIHSFSGAGSGSGSGDSSADAVEDGERRSSISNKQINMEMNGRRRTMEKDKHDKDPFTFSAEDFDKFADFVNEVGLDLIFDLNAFTRNSDKSWNSSNAMKILDHVAEKGYRVGWELGNEPNRYIKYGEDKVISGTQAGNDFIKLSDILKKNPKYGSFLIGPDVTRPKGGGSSEKFLTEFLTAAGSVVDAVTWHQYYVNGRTAELDDFTDPDVLELFRQQILIANGILQGTGTKKPLWLGETSSAWGGGAAGLSDSYAAAFTYLDKLGLAGVYCNQVVMRQSILSGKYALLNNDFSPRPDYWLAFLHKRLVGTKVLMVEGGDKTVRIYAHCSKDSAEFPPGTVTMMAMNLDKTKSANITLQGRLRKKSIQQYLVTPPSGNLLSNEVLLNGKLIQMMSDTDLPELLPEKVKQPLKLPPSSYAFYVIDKAGVNACKDQVTSYT